MDADKLDSMRNTDNFLKLFGIPRRKLFMIANLTHLLYLCSFLFQKFWFEADRVMHKSELSSTNHLLGIFRKTNELAISCGLAYICQVLTR